MGKFKWILLGFAVLIAIVLVYAYFYLTKSSVVVAMLNVEEGKVLVDKGRGFIEGADGMKLGLKDIVKTEDGKASVILYESIIVSLNENTEISIEELSKKNVKVKQEEGVTWNKFTGLLGIGALTVETPETMATVRGTSFELALKEILVAEGEVEFGYAEEKAKVSGGEKQVLEEGKLVKKKLSEEEKKRMIDMIERHIEVLRKVREKEIEKKKFVVENLMERYGISNDELKNYFKEAEQGKINLDEIASKIPVEIETLRKVRGITEEIIESNKAIEKLRES